MYCGLVRKEWTSHSHEKGNAGKDAKGTFIGKSSQNNCYCFCEDVIACQAGSLAKEQHPLEKEPS
jgi:hypothetical protein